MPAASGKRQLHSLAIICGGWSLLVLLLFWGALIFRELGIGEFMKPYLSAEFGTQDWIASHARRPPVHPEFVFLAQDAASESLDGLWDDELNSHPVLPLMKKKSWS